MFHKAYSLICSFVFIALSTSDAAGNAPVEKIYKVTYNWETSGISLDFFFVPENLIEGEGRFALYFYDQNDSARLTKAEGTYTLTGDEIVFESGRTVYRGTVSSGGDSMQGHMSVDFYSGTWTAASTLSLDGLREKAGTLYSLDGESYGSRDMEGGSLQFQQDGVPLPRYSFRKIFVRKAWAVNAETMSFTCAVRHSRPYFAMNAFPSALGRLLALLDTKEGTAWHIGQALIILPALLNSDAEYFPGGQRFFSMRTGLDYDWFHINPFDRLNRFGANAGISVHMGNTIVSGDYHYFFSRCILSREEGTNPVIGITVNYMFHY